MGINYRPEIDGLRTIAVMAVIVFHADILFGTYQILKGGFLGVDIFFVISGFLITSILIKEYDLTGSISIKTFYERRARRLLPALFIVILFSIPFSLALLLPSQQVDFAKSILSTIAFGSNFYWHYSFQEYGAESALLKPFLHTWTLAVEEQFYIIFPLLLLALNKYFRSHPITILFVLFLISLALSEYMSFTYSSFSFYMVITRFWELLAGSILAFIMIAYPKTRANNLYEKSMPAIGLILILYSIFFISFDSNHPGIITIIPILGTALIIYFSNPNELTTKILSTKLFVGIGLISYSLYLWHYPIFAFGRFINRTPTWEDKAIWIVLSFLLSIISFYALERPFRNRNKINSRRFIYVSVVAYTLIAIFMAIIIFESGFKSRILDRNNFNENIELDHRLLGREAWDVLENIHMEFGYSSFSNINRPINTPSESELNEKWFSDNKETQKVLVLGNSHGRDFFNVLELNKDLFEGYEFARFGIRTNADHDQLSKLISSPNFKAADILIISQRFSESKNYLIRLNEFVESLKGYSKDIIITSNSPVFNYYAGSQNIIDGLIEERVRINDSIVNPLYFELLDLSILEINQEIKNIARSLDVAYLDKFDFVCKKEEFLCYGLTPNGRKTHYDDNHYTISGAKYFGSIIFENDLLSIFSPQVSPPESKGSDTIEKRK